MKPQSRRRQSIHRGLFSVLILAGLLGAWFWFDQRKTAPTETHRGEAVAVTQSEPLAVVPPASGTNDARSSMVAVAAPPASASNSVAQTASDGKDLASIRKWAHNELEVERMVNENEKIYRRQLVVLKETAAAIVERNRLTGEQIRQLTLQGLDGQEISFEVKRLDIESSGLRGTFHGQVAGRPDSMVTLAFLQTRQAYTVLSPTDNLYLDVEPHDPGDVIVKSINLEKYGVGLCGTK